MPIYRFLFAKENPELFSRCIYPVSEISVWYENTRYSAVEFNGNEEILIDLPQEAIDRLHAGTATIIPLVLANPLLNIQSDGRTDQLNTLAVILHRH